VTGDCTAEQVDDRAILTTDKQQVLQQGQTGSSRSDRVNLMLPRDGDIYTVLPNGNYS